MRTTVNAIDKMIKRRVGEQSVEATVMVVGDTTIHVRRRGSQVFHPVNVPLDHGLLAGDTIMIARSGSGWIYTSTVRLLGH